MAVRLVRTAALLLLGLYAGGVVFTVLAPSLATIPGDAYVPYWQALNDDYGATMPVLLLTCVALLIATAVLARNQGPVGWGPPAFALLLVVLSIVVTLTQMEPLNAIADGWRPTALPADWTDLRDRWLTWHLVRSVLALAAFVGLLGGQAITRPAERDREKTVAATAP